MKARLSLYMLPSTIDRLRDIAYYDRVPLGVLVESIAIGYIESRKPVPPRKGELPRGRRA